LKLKLFVLALFALLFTGCLGSSGGPGTAELGVYLTQTAFPSLSLQALGAEEIREVWVSMAKVTARINGQWVTLLELPADAGEINLKELLFRAQLLGATSIPAGKLSEIRFELRENQAGGHLYNYLVFADGRIEPLKLPSRELKPELNLVIARDSAVELVFDVNLDYFAERGSGGYTVNPRKALRFLDSYWQEFASLSATIELPPGLGEILTVELKLLRVGDQHPIWSAELQDGVLSFQVTSLPAGEYTLEAAVKLADLATLTFSSGPFHLEGGTNKQIVLGSRGK